MEKFGEQELRAPTKGQGWLPSSEGSVVCASLGITLGVLFVVFWEGQFLLVLEGMERLQNKATPTGYLY